MKTIQWASRLSTTARWAFCSLLFAGSAAMTTTIAQVSFTKITEGPLVQDTGFYNAGTWADYDNDGYIDVILTQRLLNSTAQLYRNQGDGTFARVMDSALVAAGNYTIGFSCVDYDNDGDLDFFSSTAPGSPSAFYRNDGPGLFVGITEGEWVNIPGWNEISTWGDYDNDGYVDLYVANDQDVNFFYRNNGDGTTTPLTSPANEESGPSHGAAWSDYDCDGDLDLFVGGQTKTLFRNDGNGVLTWIPPAEGGLPGISNDFDTGFATADYDNDGDLDLVWGTFGGATFYRNEGEVGFVEAASTLPPPRKTYPMGLSWGDYDNDGHLDLYISSWGGEKNSLYHNNGDGSFSVVEDTPLTSEASYSGSSNWIDYDNDGDLDLFVANGFQIHGTPSQEVACELFRNDGNANHWLSIELIGIVSNRSAVGAKIWALTTIDGKDTVQLREISASGNGQGQSGFRAHFGLGDTDTVDRLRIEWPSGIVQDLTDVAADQILTIMEEIPWRTKLAKGRAAVVYRFEDIPIELARRPEGITIGPDGYLGISDRHTDGTAYQENFVGMVSASKGRIAAGVDLGAAEPGFNGVLGMASDAMGNGYAAMAAGNENHGVWKVTSAGVKTLLPGSENIVVPNAIALDYEGNVYITDSYPAEPNGPGLVWRYEPGGTCEVWASSELLAPDPVIDPFPFPGPGANGVVFVPPDHLYVANTEKSLILDIPIMPDGSAGEVEVVAGAWPPTGPPSLLYAPDGLAADIEGNLYSVVPPAGLAPIPLAPVIKIYPATGEVEAVVPPITKPSPLFDYPTSLTFGYGPLDNTSLFVISGTPGAALGSGPAITQVGTGVQGGIDWGISFPDANLEAAIRAELGKSNEPILISDLKAMTTLDASGRGIEKLTNLGLATAMTTIDLSGNQLTTIAALAYMPNLQQVDLHNNYLDLTPNSPAMRIINPLIRRASVVYQPQHVPADEMVGERLLNLSTRGWVGSGDAVLVDGFAVGGTKTIQVLIRGIGPSLAQFGVVDTLENPAIHIHRMLDGGGSELVAKALDAGGTKERIAEENAGAFQLDTAATDAVLLVRLSPGLYTVTLAGKNGEEGIGLIEVYQVY